MNNLFILSILNQYYALRASVSTAVQSKPKNQTAVGYIVNRPILEIPLRMAYFRDFVFVNTFHSTQD